MIASLFRKSTPLNYTIIIVLVLLFFSLYHFLKSDQQFDIQILLEQIAVGGAIFGSLFLVNFIVKKNGVSKDTSYSILFFFLFALFFPGIFDNLNIVLSNFFILLAMRRMMSLHSLKSHKEKVFDASLWVFVAALFHFWSILFIALVFISILFHVARDYKNWLLPFIALFAVTMTFVFFSLLIDPGRIDHVMAGMNTDVSLDYFSDTSQNIAFSIYATVALFFLVSFASTFSARPLMLHSSYKKIVLSFFIGALVFVTSANKSNELLLFTIAPMAMISAAHLEITKSRFQKEFIVSLVTISAFYNFFAQL